MRRLRRVGDETKFACVDGPEFDGHLIDWELAIRRSTMYQEEEKIALEKENAGVDVDAIDQEKTPMPAQDAQEESKTSMRWLWVTPKQMLYKKQNAVLAVKNRLPPGLSR